MSLPLTISSSETRPDLILALNVWSTTPVVASIFTSRGRAIPLTVVNFPPM